MPSFGSGEEDLFKVFTIYWQGGHLGHLTWTIYINFGSPFPRRLHIKMSLIGHAVSKTTTFEIVDGRTTGRRRLKPDHEYPISSPMSLWLR